MRGAPGISVARLSRVYLTEPQEHKDQPWFANQVARLEIDDSISARDLLEILAGIEAEMGRSRRGRATDVERYGPRIIDLDILLFGDEIHTGEDLAVPHPRMKGRAFVLVPLAEIAPDLVLPDGTTVESALSALDYGLDGHLIYQA